MTTTVPAGLDALQRSTLERLVIRARALLENDLASQAEGRFGIHLNGTIEDEAALPDDTTDKITRRDLEQIVAHLRTLGEDPPGAVGRLLREAAFTHLNRLVAIRIAEAIGLLPESLANGAQSSGFKDLGEIMPTLASDYRAYVGLCGDELAADAPALFDPRNPLLALEPSTAAFDQLVALLADRETTDIWLAPDTLGWAYQFFNTGDERREMRESSAPRNSRELAVRNQFFTPRYVVEFLVQNTIGRRLIENDPASALLAELPLLVDPPTEPGRSLDLEEVKCLDPACGSGHFLLGCYDVLERAWELIGIPPEESAPSIVASLWGVDIDLRCAQVASAAIVLRARRHCRELPLPRPNIVTARGLPGDASDLPPELDITDGQRGLIDRIGQMLATAPLLGVLLKAEDALALEIRHGAFEGAAGMFELSDDETQAAERELLNHLRAISDQASSSVVERLLAAEADDALRLIDIVRQRYDVILMNPPFGEPVQDTKPYLASAYPNSWKELAAAFIERAVGLLGQGGKLGALVSRQVLFVDGLEDWRRQQLLGDGAGAAAHVELRASLDLGVGVLQGAIVEVAALCLASNPEKDPAWFASLLRSHDKEADLYQHDYSLHTVPVNAFRSLGKASLPYWLGESTLTLYGGPGWRSLGLQARTGPQTDDDFRLLRLEWELPPGSAGRETKWLRVAKGGEYEPYWDDIHLVVNWDDWKKRPRSRSDYTTGGLTYPYRTTSDHCMRVLPRGCGYTRGGPAIQGGPEELLVAMACCFTRPYKILTEGVIGGGDISGGAAARNYSAPWLSTIPLISTGTQTAETTRLACKVVQLSKFDSSRSETGPYFAGPFMDSSQASSGLQDEAVKRRRALLNLAALRLELSVTVEEHYRLLPGLTGLNMDELWAPHPELLPRRSLDSESVAALWQMPESELLQAAREAAGITRPTTIPSYLAHRRLELIAYVLDARASCVAEVLGDLPPTNVELQKVAADVMSFAFGVAMSRFATGVAPKIGIGVEESFAALPLMAPAVRPIGPSAADLLIDEPGHVRDVEAVVLSRLESLFEDPGSALVEILQSLGRQSIRDYIRRDFFKAHLARYSKSRRRAPIYWPLTVPSKNWGVWLHAPALTREALYAVSSEAGRRERLATETIARLQREQHESGTGRPARKLAEELDSEEKLVEELRRFRAEVERIAGLGWEPDLSDGIILCAAPLADLIPSWPDAKTARTELRSGKYEWASVAAWADQL
jgi:hypothetical protein